jgi:hypothetical protein
VALDLRDGSPLLSGLVHPDLRPLRTTYEGDFGEPLGDVYYFPSPSVAGLIPSVHASSLQGQQSDSLVHQDAGFANASISSQCCPELINVEHSGNRAAHNKLLAADVDTSGHGCSMGFESLVQKLRTIRGTSKHGLHSIHSRNSNLFSVPQDLIQKCSSKCRERLLMGGKMLAFEFLKASLKGPKHGPASPAKDASRLRAVASPRGQAVIAAYEQENAKSEAHRKGLSDSRQLEGILLCFPRHVLWP